MTNNDVYFQKNLSLNSRFHFNFAFSCIFIEICLSILSFYFEAIAKIESFFFSSKILFQLYIRNLLNFIVFICWCYEIYSHGFIQP